MKINYKEVESILNASFDQIDLVRNEYGMFLYFENGEQVRVSILSGDNQHSDVGIHVFSFENEEQLQLCILDAVERARRGIFANIFIHNPF